MMSNNLHHHYYHLLATIAVLGTLLSSILITTTAYAQPQQQRGPCPEGFTLNRGICQAAPDITELSSCPDGYSFNEAGECQSDDTTDERICPDGFGFDGGDICRSLDTVLATCPVGSEPFGNYGIGSGGCGSGELDANGVPEITYDEKDCPNGYDYVGANACRSLETTQDRDCPNGYEPVISSSRLETCRSTATTEAIPGGSEPVCDVGDFNEESGLCEVKPGRRNR